MANKSTFKPMTPFALAFAMEYKGWMKGHNVTLRELAEVENRTHPYILERVNGKRALDTLDVDALAGLTGTTGRDLMIELARRTKESIASDTNSSGHIDLTKLSEEEKKRFVLDQLRNGDTTLAANYDPNKEAERDYYPDAGA
jgi:hypothetical protein